MSAGAGGMGEGEGTESTREADGDEPAVSPDDRPGLANWIVTSIALMGILIWTLVLMYSVPSFARMFEDLGQRLPAVTTLVISVPALLWLALGAGTGFCLFAKNFLLTRRRALQLDALALVGIFLFTLVVIAVLFVPLLDIAHSLE